MRIDLAQLEAGARAELAELRRKIEADGPVPSWVRRVAELERGLAVLAQCEREE